MNKKIIVIGAGVGGTYCAERLGKLGNDVTVFESSPKGGVSYDWHDDVNPKVFDDLGIELPKEPFWFRKGNWCFVPPSENTFTEIHLPEEKLDYSVERRKLADFLIARAEPYAKFIFNADVERLITDGDEIKGVVVNGEEHFADLVIDDSGLRSPFRPTEGPENDEVFKAYRAFHERRPGSPDPEHTNPVYMKHLGELGISWAIKDPSGTVNVLIGRIGELDKAALDNALCKLKESNPIIGDRVLRGGGIYDVSVRYPLTRMCKKGYVAIGDCAFQTIPMLGSGIEMSLRAADILANVVKKTGSVCRGTLWMYEVEYFKRIGADHCSTDVLKRFLLKADPADVDFLFGSGVISEKDFEAAAVGGEVKISLPDLITKIIKGASRLGLLLRLKGALDRGTRAKKIALSIPEKYDETAIKEWECRLKRQIKS